jgi:hypothetical protein
MVLIVVVIANSEFLILFLLNPEITAYYYAYSVMLSVSFLFGLRYYWE